MNIKELDSRKTGFSYFNYLKLLSSTEVSTIAGIVIISCINIFLVYLNPINYPDTGNRNAFDAIAAIPALSILIILCKQLYNKKKKRIWLVLATEIFTLAIFVAAICGMSSIALTPHTRIDSVLNHFDQSIGFNLPAVMAWTRSNILYLYICHYAYNSWFFQITLIPLLISLLGNYHRVTRYFFSFIMSSCIGGAIYYIWPTTAPATVVHSKYFIYTQYNLVKNFALMRAGNTHMLPSDGLVAFPSFHVIGAVLITLLVWKNKILRWPITLLNLTLIFATMGLGYHYLADVLAGATIAFGTFYLSGLIAKIKYPKNQI